MEPLVTQSNEQQDVGRAYAKRIGAAVGFQFLLRVLGIWAYCYFNFNQSSTLAVQAIISNFYLRIILCWIPVWAIHSACGLPFLWRHFRLDRQFGLSQSSFTTTLLEFLKANVLTFILGGLVLEIAFVSHRTSSSYGWLLAGMLCAILLLLVTETLPWILSLFYPVLPLSDPSLRDRLALLIAKAGVRIGRIDEWHISGRTRRANALVTGIGRTRRIVLTDTLIGGFSQEEVEAIVAHELGHCALHHVLKRILLQGAIYCGFFWVINGAVRNGLVWRADESLGWADLNLIPGVLLIYVVLYVYGHLITSSFSRGQERSADLYSWKIIGSARPFITAMRKLSELNLIVFDNQSEWKHTHPSTAARIAAAEQYEKEHVEFSSTTQAANSGSSS